MTRRTGVAMLLQDGDPASLEAAQSIAKSHCAVQIVEIVARIGETRHPAEPALRTRGR